MIEYCDKTGRSTAACACGDCVVGWHKAQSGAMLEVRQEAVRTCPECGSENAYECPDPAEFGVLVCWCDGLDSTDSL